MSSATTSAAFFEAKYRRTADPWHFASSSYELNRYADIVSSLKPRTFKRAFEAGCSIGVLTSQLAARCTRVVALDISPTAVGHARERCRHLTNVDIQVGSLLTDIPQCPFDLIVLSEVGYYFEPNELASMGALLCGNLTPGGILLGAHWVGHSDDHRLSGDEVHEIIGRLPGLQREFSQRREGYRMDHWIRV